jgi:hypothetical protein
VKDDFKEASSAPDVILRKKLQTQTLAAMFETYFGVLKASLEPPDEKYASLNCHSCVSLVYLQLRTRVLLLSGKVTLYDGCAGYSLQSHERSMRVSTHLACGHCWVLLSMALASIHT